MVGENGFVKVGLEEMDVGFGRFCGSILKRRLVEGWTTAEVEFIVVKMAHRCCCVLL